MVMSSKKMEMGKRVDDGEDRMHGMHGRKQDLRAQLPTCPIPHTLPLIFTKRRDIPRPPRHSQFLSSGLNVGSLSTAYLLTSFTSVTQLASYRCPRSASE